MLAVIGGGLVMLLLDQAPLVQAFWIPPAVMLLLTAWRARG